MFEMLCDFFRFILIIILILIMFISIIITHIDFEQSIQTYFNDSIESWEDINNNIIEQDLVMMKEGLSHDMQQGVDFDHGEATSDQHGEATDAELINPDTSFDMQQGVDFDHGEATSDQHGEATDSYENSAAGVPEPKEITEEKNNINKYFNHPYAILGYFNILMGSILYITIFNKCNYCIVPNKVNQPSVD